MAMPSVGRDAVIAAKKVSSLKNSVALEKEEASAGTKSVEDKTFYLVNGYWTDSEFNSSKQKPQEVQFGSKEYFDLVRANPELRKYLTVSPQVIVVWKGHCYKILPPVTT